MTTACNWKSIPTLARYRISHSGYFTSLNPHEYCMLEGDGACAAAGHQLADYIVTGLYHRPEVDLKLATKLATTFPRRRFERLLNAARCPSGCHWHWHNYSRLQASSFNMQVAPSCSSNCSSCCLSAVNHGPCGLTRIIPIVN
jgi:hypothetical protein